MNGSNWVKDLYITDYTRNPDNRHHSKYGDIALRATVWRTDRGPGGPEIILEKGKFYRHRNLCVKHDPQGFLEGKIRLDSESDKLSQVALGHQDERFIAFKE
jgi:hypothetical protein